MGMHDLDAENEDLVRRVIDYALERFGCDSPLDGPRSAGELQALVGDTITPAGLGGTEALRTFAEHLAPACIPADHPRYLAFVASAPTLAASRQPSYFACERGRLARCIGVRVYLDRTVAKV